MKPAGVSGTVIISNQRSYIKIKTLSSKNPTEIDGALSEVHGVFTTNHSKISHWANRFRGGCVSIDSDPRPGRPRTSTDERSAKLVALLKKAVVQSVNNFLEPLEQNLRSKMHKKRPQLFVAGQLILNDNARSHLAVVVTKSFTIMGGKYYLIAFCSPDMSPPDFDLFPK